jgi:hypothetical protein
MIEVNWRLRSCDSNANTVLLIHRDSLRLRMSYLIRYAFIAGLTCSLVLMHASADETGTRLIPVERSLEIADGADYRRLYERKLFVTRADLARFTYLPGLSGTEQTVAVYQSPGKAGSFPGSFWVTATEASGRLLACIPIPGQEERPVDPRSISVRRDDGPLPASTAQTLHAVWLAMLARTQPLHQQVIRGDTPTLLFAGLDSRGNLLRAQADSVKGNTKDLWRIADSLIEYCRAPQPQRAELALQLEIKSSRLLKRVNQGG